MMMMPHDWIVETKTPTTGSKNISIHVYGFCLALGHALILVTCVILEKYQITYKIF